MNIVKTKFMIKELIGKNVNFLVSLGRNKEERFNGVIVKTYSNVFSVMVDNIMKSYSYNDVLTGNVKIKKI